MSSFKNAPTLSKPAGRPAITQPIASFRNKESKEKDYKDYKERKEVKEVNAKVRSKIKKMEIKTNFNNITSNIIKEK